MMTIFLLMAALLIPTAKAPAFQPTDPLRNPFWPINYDYSESDLEAITTNPIVKVITRQEEDGELSAANAAAAAALAKSSVTILAQSWSEATKEIHFRGKTTVFDPSNGVSRTAFFINGNTYTIGDLISVNHGGRRFTWRIRQKTDVNTLKLEQVRVVELHDEESDVQNEKDAKKGTGK